MFYRPLLSSLFLFLFILLQGSLSAQRLNEFSEDPSVFLKEFKEFFTSSKQDKMEEAFENFEELYTKGGFSDEQKEVIFTTSNAMLSKKMKAKSHFLPYLEVLTNVRSKTNAEQLFTQWHEVFNSMLDDFKKVKSKNIREFLKFSQSFLTTGTFREASAGVNWYGISDDFNFKYQDYTPTLSYDKVDLIAYRKADTIQIKETAGTYYPTTLEWKGVGGKIDWDRFGDSVDISVEIDTYHIDIKKSLYRVSKATLNYPEIFGAKKIKGSFEDKIMSKSSNTYSYPRFESADQVLKIDEFGDGISYKGGFRLHGTTVYGWGTKENKAIIQISEEGKKRFKGFSESFTIRKGERIASEKTEMVIYIEKDSIYHPSINIKFDIPSKEMQLFRGNRGSDRNPFYSSRQNMNINVDKLLWKMASDSLLLGTSAVSFANASKVEFESMQYYEEGDMRRIQNISTTNPLMAIRQFADEEGVRQLNASNLAKKINPRFDESSIQSLLYDLVAQGFINYDSDEQIVTVKDKVYHYTDASAGKVDFDILRITSETEETNAVMDLKENAIYTQGVKSVEFSPVQKVALKPFNDNITFQANRDMDFDGRIFAGFGTLEGKNMHYDYEMNQISIDSVRYFDLFVPNGEEDEKGNPIALSISSRIEHGNGVLLIDAPDNKSGKEELPMFPSYNTKGPSYVFYDFKENHDGVYKRDSFFFKLDKFSFNSLDNFTEEEISFKGEMHSANIFPVFKETVLIREEDASLGFVTNSGTGGYPCYTSKGKYIGEIDLSNQGFYGKGNITYLGATMDSEDLLFKPKRMTGTAKRFDLSEDRQSSVEVPQAVGIFVYFYWKPYLDCMYIQNKELSFKLFKADNYTMDGTLILTPGGLKADGKFEWEQGILSSKLMSFGAFSVLADTSNLQIKAFEDEFAFDTKNVNANLNFDTQKGKIIANADGLSTTMPYNQYQTSMGELDWDMKNETITFFNKDKDFGDFVSIAPDQDSLNFKGKTAFYNLKTNELKIGGVEKIQTCDANVFPETGDIEIKKGGLMTPLTNAKIIASLENEYHVINRAEVNIEGRKSYKAKGYYEYNIGDKKQEIYFADIIGARVGKGNQTTKDTETRAKGTVKPEDNFYMDVKTLYQGEITLNANDKNLDFDGYAKLDAPLLPNREWFYVKNKADKKNVVIQFDLPKNFEGEFLRTGIFLSKELGTAYPRIMQPTRLRKDRAIIDGRGVFKYDKSNDQFIFGDSSHVVANNIRGNQVIYDLKTNAVNAEGTLNIGDQLDYVEVTTTGTAEIGFEGGTANTHLEAEALAGIFMHVPEKLVKIMVTDFVSSSYDARPIDYTKNFDFYKKAIADLISNDKDYKNTLAKTQNMGLELPKKLNNFSFVFSKLKLKWDAEYQSMVSVNNENPLAIIGGTPINRMIKSHVEFKMPSNGDDRVYIYVKSPSDNFYYFGYKQGILQVGSSNPKFTDELLGMKDKELSIKMKDGERMEIQAVEAGKANMFVSRVKAAKSR